VTEKPSAADFMSALWRRLKPDRSDNHPTPTPQPGPGKHVADKPQTADEVIRTMRSSRAAYLSAAKGESDVWGKLFSDQEFLATRSDDQAAAAELGLNDGKPSLAAMLARQGIEPRSGLSLGCGSGRAERAFLKQGICERFTGIDVAEDAVVEARRHATADGLPLDYECQDLNTIDLGGRKFDLIVCQTILHHVLELEHLLDAVEQALTANGLFFVHDYVGETQFQFTDARLRWYNLALKALPQALRNNLLTKRILDEVRRPVPGKLVSPFEAIRSGDIRELLMSRFDVVELHECTTILDRVIPVGTRRGFLADENTRAMFAMLMLLDRALLEGNVLPPLEGRYLLRRKSGQHPR